MSTIIDTHTHLYDIPDLVQALSLSSESGVSDVVALGVDYSSNTRHLDFAKVGFKTAPVIHLGLGIHPGNITPEDVEQCFSLFRDVLGKGTSGGFPEIVAIGEIGLDFWYKWVRRDDVKKAEQRLVFQRQLDLAKEFDLPVVVHSRGTWRECLDRLVATGIRKADFHWYSGPVDVLKDILDAGYVISVTPALVGAIHESPLRKAAEYAPIEQIMVETDTPVRFAIPGGSERMPSIPKDVWRTFHALCVLKKLDKEKALSRVNANARAFFNI
ncbi:MAG: TatD family hydrolase [Candidatus Omnitrophota bacterium]